MTLVEPGGFSTDWSGPSAVRSATIDAYDDVREAREKQRSGIAPGDPEASGPAILEVVDATPPPLRVFFGTAPLGIATKDYESRLATWNEWQPLAERAQGGGAG